MTHIPGQSTHCSKVGDFTQVGIWFNNTSGITLGKHVLVGAGTVVTKSVPDNYCVLGNPGELKKSGRYNSGWLSEAYQHVFRRHAMGRGWIFNTAWRNHD